MDYQGNSNIWGNVYKSQKIQIDGYLVMYILFILIPLMGFIFMKLYLKTGWRETLKITLIAIFFSFVLCWEYFGSFLTILVFRGRLIDETIVLVINSYMFFTFAAVALLYKMYLKWSGRQLTETEKRPDLEGLKSWLNTGNLICCALIGLPFLFGQFGTKGFLAAFFISLCIVILYPLAIILKAKLSVLNAGKRNSASDDLQAKLKILDMLEQGKITPQECTELLKAMQREQHTYDGSNEVAHPQEAHVGPTT